MDLDTLNRKKTTVSEILNNCLRLSCHVSGNIQQCKFTFPPSLNTADDLSFPHPVGYVFLINIPVPPFQFPNQIAFRNLAVAEQPVFTDLVTQNG